MLKSSLKAIGIGLLIVAAYIGVYTAYQAVAQTINSSLQVSQDPRGPVALDTQSNIYFPKHVNVVNAAPTVTGTGTPTVSGADSRGTITMGTSATTATLVFATAFNSIPDCVAVSITAATTISYVPATTSLAITQNTASGNKISYWCSSNS